MINTSHLVCLLTINNHHHLPFWLTFKFINSIHKWYDFTSQLTNSRFNFVTCILHMCDLARASILEKVSGNSPIKVYYNYSYLFFPGPVAVFTLFLALFILDVLDNFEWTADGPVCCLEHLEPGNNTSAKFEKQKTTKLTGVPHSHTQIFLSKMVTKRRSKYQSLELLIYFIFFW